MPKTLAAREQFSVEFDRIRMKEGDGPLEYLGRIDYAVR